MKKNPNNFYTVEMLHLINSTFNIFYILSYKNKTVALKHKKKIEVFLKFEMTFIDITICLPETQLSHFVKCLHSIKKFCFVSIRNLLKIYFSVVI